MLEQETDATVSDDAVDDVGLGDAGKKAIDAERDARKAADAARKTAEAQAAEYKERLDAIEREKLSDVEKAQADAVAAVAETERLKAELASKELHILRQTIGVEFNLNPGLIARLQGDDETTLRADAKTLTELVSGVSNSPFPKADPSQGARGTVTGINEADREMIAQLFPQQT